MATDDDMRENALKICYVLLSIAILSTYIGYHPPISDFCSNNTTFTKINNVIIESPEIIDVHKMLGKSGKVIQLYRDEGITIFSFIGVIIVTSCLSGFFSLILAIALFICEVVFSIIFIDLYFKDVIPLQCIDSLMGNNVAYYTMQIKVILNIVILSFGALCLIVVACTVLVKEQSESRKKTQSDFVSQF